MNKKMLEETIYCLDRIIELGTKVGAFKRSVVYDEKYQICGNYDPSKHEFDEVIKHDEQSELHLLQGLEELENLYEKCKLKASGEHELKELEELHESYIALKLKELWELRKMREYRKFNMDSTLLEYTENANILIRLLDNMFASLKNGVYVINMYIEPMFGFYSYDSIEKVDKRERLESFDIQLLFSHIVMYVLPELNYSIEIEPLYDIIFTNPEPLGRMYERKGSVKFTVNQMS